MRVKKLVWIGALSVTGLCALVAGVIGYLVFYAEPPVRGGPATMRLISAEQYRNTIAYVFGDDIQVDANFPVLQRQEGLIALGATTATMTPAAFDQFDRAARAIAGQVVDPAHRDILVPCRPRRVNGADPQCAEAFFTKTGRLLHRRPLDRTELGEYVQLASAAANDRGDFYAGLAYALSGMLSSPKFLYITELTEPDAAQPSGVKLDPWSQASRLSFFLWNAPPDEELLASVESGEFAGKAGRRRQIDRMLASPRLEQGMRGFFSDLLQFQEYETISKDPVIYPSFTFDTSKAVHEQTLRMIVDELLVRRGDYRDLFTTNKTFVNRDLGPIYRVPVSAAATDEWLPLELDPDQSAGIVTGLSFLSAHSHPGRSSPTLRGRAIREIFLCQRLPDPPPTVNFALFENLTGKLTARDRLKAHVTDASCAGCHKMTDPLGLGMENYDGAGQFRTEENKVKIDTSGEFDGKPFRGVAEVGRAIHDHPSLSSCLTRRVYAYGVGRNPGAGDRQWLAWARRQFATSGHKVPELLKRIAASDAFYAVAPAEGDPGQIAEIPERVGG